MTKHIISFVDTDYGYVHEENLDHEPMSAGHSKAFLSHKRSQSRF